jgi:Ca2+-binding EF-hand superfamily protein
MNKTLLTFSLVAATAMFGQDRGRRGDFGPPGGFMRMNPALAALDADQDGTVSAAELANAAAALKSLDKDNDGKISAEEMRPRMGGRGGPGGPGGPAPAGRDPEEMVKSLMEFDKNSDGVLTKDELPERMQGMIARADTDNDGKLTKDELTKSVSAMRGPGGSGAPGGRGPGGPGMMRMDRVFSALDSDQDGAISAAEISAASSSLAKLDANKDGKLTEEEVRPNFGGPGGRARRPE